MKFSLFPQPCRATPAAGHALALGLACLLAAAPARAADHALGTGVTTAGGARSASSRYANQATLGQISGPRLSGGVYRAFSGFPTVLARTTTTPPAPGAPFLSVIGNQLLREDTPSGLVPFTVFDPDTPPAQLTVTRTSSNPGLIRAADLVFGGTGTNRTLRITPRPDQTGSAVVTLSISDPQNHTTSQSFLVEVLPENDPPTIVPIADLKRSRFTSRTSTTCPTSSAWWRSRTTPP